MKWFLMAAIAAFAQGASAYTAHFQCMDQRQPNLRILVDIGEGKAAIQAPGVNATYALTKQHDFLPTNYVFGNSRDCVIEFAISGDRHSGTASFRCSAKKYPQAPRIENLPCWLND